MFSIDQRLRGVPATRDQVVALHQSLNSPHLAIPGKQAGPAQGFIVGVRAAGGFAIFVYLYLADLGDCAVYVSDQRNLSPDQFKEEESEALGFVESMGFMMDNTNYRGLAQDRQDELIRTLPVFQKEPRRPAAPARPAPTGKTGATAVAPPAAPPDADSAALGKLFTSF
ncbi:MAG: social motility and stimulation tgl protein [Myxococcota bacterium]|nr:social motility and stimulation tgl protein [Myxococcota bacterium]